jgi:hypothetical protein
MTSFHSERRRDPPALDSFDEAPYRRFLLDSSELELFAMLSSLKMQFVPM